MKRLLSRVRAESGQALISALILLAGVLIPVLFLHRRRPPRLPPTRRSPELAHRPASHFS